MSKGNNEKSANFDSILSGQDTFLKDDSGSPKLFSSF